jgi:putative membrane protein
MESDTNNNNAQKSGVLSSLRLFLIGCGMGVADLVPGVSGGTIAFIANIYDEFLAALKTVLNNTPLLVLRGKFKEALHSIPFRFLLPLGFGIMFAVFSMAHILSRLLESYAVYVWAFFFGLVATSVFVVFGHIRKRTIESFLFLALGAVIAFILTGLIPVETPATPLLIFLSGAVAITAMILPGISGSFILIILGKYQQILLAVAERDLVTLGIFIAGIVIGLALFSRIVSYLLRKHHDAMVALLTGFMLGSLRSIWPWKEYVGEGVQRNILPEAFDVVTVTAIILAVMGAVIILALSRLHIEKTAEVK